MARAIFGTQFYPTPASLANRMLTGVNFGTGIRSVLEPSAGTGDLIDAVNRHARIHSRFTTLDIDAIEIDPDLAAILAGKGHRVVWDDFLTFQSWKRYDLIVMNPPFADGAKHLAKALDLQARYGGVTVCLLNAETLRNPHSQERLDLADRLNSDTVSSGVEYVSGAFISADRPTDVEVAIVTVTTTPVDRSSFIRAEFRAAEEREETTSEHRRHDRLVAGDAIADLICDFDLEAQAGVRLIELWEQTSNLLASNDDGPYSSRMLNLQVGRGDASVNEYLVELRHRYWAKLFEHPSLTSKLTVQMRDELRHRIDEFAGYDFNLRNIRTLQGALISGLNAGVETEALAVFDTLSQKHAMNRFSKNVHYYSGWKTNDAWKINSRVIIPTYLGYFHSWGSSKVVDILSDIELVLNYFDGMTPIEVPAAKRLNRASDIPFGRKLSFHYFDATVYAKGTIHLTFNCPELVKRLNVFAGKHYNMLPPNYGTHAYQDLPADERSLVDEFEGAESYQQTRRYLAAGGSPQLAIAS